VKAKWSSWKQNRHEGERALRGGGRRGSKTAKRRERHEGEKALQGRKKKKKKRE